MEPTGNKNNTGLSQKKSKDDTEGGSDAEKVPDHAGDLDNAKFKHQFEARNDYNANAKANNHYPQPTLEPTGNGVMHGTAMEKKEEKKEEKKAEKSLAQKKNKDESEGVEKNPHDAGSLDDAKFKHQFEAKNDYNAAAGAKVTYPQPPPEPTGNKNNTGLS